MDAVDVTIQEGYGAGREVDACVHGQGHASDSLRARRGEVQCASDRLTSVGGGYSYHLAQCALERRIPILKPTYVTENYEVWLRGDDVDAVGVRVLP